MPAIATQQELDVRSSAWSDDDAKVDEALLGSFPASDSPPWTLGVIARPFRTHGCEDGSAKETALKVRDTMSTDLKPCGPTPTVAEAAHLMWERDCGILSVVDPRSVLAGMSHRVFKKETG